MQVFQTYAPRDGTRLSGKKTNAPVPECCPSDWRNDIFKDCNVRSWRGGQMVWEGDESIHVRPFWTANSESMFTALLKTVSLFLAVSAEHGKRWFVRHTTSCEDNARIGCVCKKQHNTDFKTNEWMIRLMTCMWIPHGSECSDLVTPGVWCFGRSPTTAY